MAGGDFDAVGHGDARHLQRRFQVGRAVIDAGQNVAMKIDHAETLFDPRIGVALFALGHRNTTGIGRACANPAKQGRRRSDSYRRTSPRRADVSEPPEHLERPAYGLVGVLLLASTAIATIPETAAPVKTKGTVPKRKW
jgi:hypothetical protein